MDTVSLNLATCNTLDIVKEHLEVLRARAQVLISTGQRQAILDESQVVPLTTSDVLDGDANMTTAERQTGISQTTDMPDRCV